MLRTPLYKYTSLTPILTPIAILILSFFLLGNQKSNSSTAQILFVGDTSFGENYQTRKGRNNILKTKGYHYPLKNFKSLLLQSDLVIANLETPITNLPQSPFPEKGYVHWSDVRKAPKALQEHNITVVSLANNHTLDYGIKGLKQTLLVLAKNNIEWFGAGMNQKEASEPYIKEFKVGKKVFRLAVIAGFVRGDVV